MHHKKAVACASAVVLALAVACSKNAETPVSPSSAQPGGSEAGPNGETLKATAPSPQSPVNNAQQDQLVLTTAKATGLFDQGLATAYSYEFQIMNSANTMVCSATLGGGSGSSVSWTPACTLEFDAPHTWRVRAIFQGANGPWSPTATFRSPAGGYIRGNELFDPLTNGRSVGTVIGANFVGNAGLQLVAQTSRVTYQLPENLQAGEFSVMVTGFSEDSPGDKTKIMSMQEGHGDLTANDYRFTFEKRGASYETPGAVTFRFINGDAAEHDYINDAERQAVEFSDERWYFWKVTWNSTSVTGEVRRDGPNGQVIFRQSRTTNGHPYRPVPHVIHLGGTSRAGPIDASVPGAVYKNVWVSSRPRPAFPNDTALAASR